MSKFQRVQNVIVALLMLMLSLILLLVPNEGYYIVVLILSLGFLIAGIKKLVFYFSMAINMVGGKQSLYEGVIIIELALFTFSLSDIPRAYILLYLAGVNAFSGVVDVLRAFEAKKNGTTNYKLKLLHGIINLLIALSCIVFIKRPETAVYIYVAGLVYSAVVRVIMAFKKTAVVYIQ